MHKMTIFDLKLKASGRWLSILQARAPQLYPAIKHIGRHIPCPVHGGKDGFRLFNDVTETGGGICNTCGTFADGFDLLQWANGWTFAESVTAVSRCLGKNIGNPLPIKPIQKLASRPNNFLGVERKRLQSIWKATIPDNGRIQQYLESRGLAGKAPPTLRLHPSLRYYKQGHEAYYPAMVARIQKEDETVGLHLTYLDRNGPGKAPVFNPKIIRKCVESVSGGSIHLFAPTSNRPLALTEGIETALAVRDMSGFPVWACGNSSLLAKVKIPANVLQVYIGADRDRSEAGERAAQTLAQHIWDEREYGVTISLPPIEIPEGQKSVDWLDYVGQGKEVVYG